MTSSGTGSAGRHRYGIVLLLAIAEVVFLIVAPTGALSRAIGLLLTGGILLVVVATSRGDRTLRETAGAGIALVTLAAVVLVALRDAPQLLSGALAMIVLLGTIRQLLCR